ncbi:MAG: uracil-DNA glycosylase [Candidatus Riflebacteria bacterium]|nr:uracil-DNA glycosylase [Candidatus Riflebacteria bacterium]
MAKRKKKGEGEGDSPAGAPPDLFDLLTPPGEEGKYDREIAVPTGAPGVVPFADTLPPPWFRTGPRSESPSGRGEPGRGDPPAGEEPGIAGAGAVGADASGEGGTGPGEGGIGAVDGADSDGDSFAKIRRDGLACTACELYKTRTHFVLGEGPAHADLVFIGEAPGADEDATGRPFVGRAGQHLDKILTAAGFRRDEVYICNILKDRPPDNRTPTLEEMRACTPLLQRQLALLRPKLIALLGNTAVKYVVGPDAPGITKIHGQWFESIFGIPCMPMYHPSYLLRNQSRAPGSPNWEMWQDIQALKKRYDEEKGR